MKTILFAVTLCVAFTSYAQVDPAKEKILKENFDLFFSLDEGDSIEVKQKIAAAGNIIDVCKVAYSSKYCTYVSLWANVSSEKEFDFVNSQLTELERDHPDWAELHYLRAQYYSYKNEQGYIESAQKCIELNPKLVQPHYFLATKYFDLKNYKLSLRYYDLLEKLAPHHRSVYYNRANVKSAMNDTGGAITDYGKAIQQNPKHYKALYNRATLYLQQKEYAKAVSDLDAFIVLFPSYASAYYHRGMARYYLGEYDKTCADFTMAANLGNQTAADYVTKNCK